LACAVAALRQGAAGGGPDDQVRAARPVFTGPGAFGPFTSQDASRNTVALAIPPVGPRERVLKKVEVHLANESGADRSVVIAKRLSDHAPALPGAASPDRSVGLDAGAVATCRFAA